MVEEEEKEDDLKPKHPPKLASQGIRTFTIFRGHDQTGVSGEGKQLFIGFTHRQGGLSLFLIRWQTFLKFTLNHTQKTKQF